MEVFQKILTKDEIHTRFIWAVNAVLHNNLVSNKSSLAESLCVKPAKFSEILNGRMKVGVDMIAIMCDYYNISPDWILMSRGNNVFRKTALPKIWVDDGDLDLEYPKLEEVVTSDKKDATGAVQPLIDMIHDKDNVIRKQAEEIGRLKARIEELERRRGDNAGHARSSGIADVG